MDKNSYIVAIDLGSSSVKVAAGSREHDGKLNVLDVVVKPMEGMVRGEVLNIEQVTGATREAVIELEHNLDIEVTEAYMGVSGQDIKCVDNSYFVFVTGQDGEIREVDVRKLHESMENLQPPDGVAILDRIPQKYIIDNMEETLHPIGRFGHQLQAAFNFILGNKSAIDRMNRALQRLDIVPVRTYTNAQASAEAALTDDERELGAAVIDIGAGCSDICIWQDNKLRHVGVIPIGSDAINKDIRSIAIPDRFIEKLKVMHGYAVAENIPEEKKGQTIKIKGRTQRETKEVSFYNLAQIIEARITDIIEHALEEIKDAGYADKLGAGIVLTGGGARMKEIEALFREKTKYDIRIGGTEHGRVSRESYEFADDPAMTTTLGILLMGLKDSGIDVLDDPVNKHGRPAADKEEEKGPRGYEVRDDETEHEPEKGRGRERARDTGRDGEDRKDRQAKPEKEKKEKKPKEEKQPREPKPKKKLFGGIKGIFTDIFEIVDDEEI